MENNFNLDERCYPDLNSSRVVEDHIAAYHFASNFVKDKIVIDAACGEGYGSSILKNAGAKEVYGVDLDQSTIETASHKYSNIIFEQKDVVKTGFPDEMFDVAISFQTWHHLDDYKKFIPEMKRIIKPGGLLICSVPNRKVIYLNPFHRGYLTKFYKTNFDKGKIESMVGPYMKIQNWYGQRIIKPILLNPFVKFGTWFAASVSQTFEKRLRKALSLGRGPEIAPLDAENARYLIFIAKK